MAPFKPESDSFANTFQSELTYPLLNQYLRTRVGKDYAMLTLALLYFWIRSVAYIVRLYSVSGDRIYMQLNGQMRIKERKGTRLSGSDRILYGRQE